MTAEAPTDEELASLAGFTVAFFKSDSELWKTFKKALAEDWTPDKLLAGMRNTKWFKTTSQSEREALLLQKSDPAEWERRMAETKNRVSRMFAEFGFTPPKGALDNITHHAFRNGWNDDQIRKYMGGWQTAFDQAQRGGKLGGALAEAQTNIKAALHANGIRMTDQWVSTNLRYIMTGEGTEEQVLEKIRQIAASTWPGFADEIAAGQNVRDIAEPYIQTMGRLLEVNTEDIDLYDPTIRQALATKDKNGKPTSKTIWQFEEDLRKDSRWMKTNNARESIMSVANAVARDFGFVA